MFRRHRRALGALGLTLILSSAQAGEAEYLGRHVWPASQHGLGGFSGLEVSADGMGFTAISDRAAIVSGRFLREAGRIAGVALESAETLGGLDGKVMSESRGDSEGLAIDAEGRVFIAFEGQHRIWEYPHGADPVALPSAEGFADLQGNSGIEALAVDDRGHLFAIPERSGRLERPFPVWRFDGAWSQPFTLPRRGGFLVAGADFGPDGRLYVLEREFTGFGFRTRVRRFTVTETALVDEDTVIESHVLKHDNLEGISVWRDDAGAIRVTMVSDDNFNAFQRTEFVEYRLR